MKCPHWWRLNFIEHQCFECAYADIQKRTWESLVKYVDRVTTMASTRPEHPETFNTLIVYNGVAYRSAGFRLPTPGELYLNPGGKVCQMKEATEYVGASRVDPSAHRS